MNDTVVITGIGMVTSLGNTRESTWAHMLAGDCGIRRAELFDTEGYRSRLSDYVNQRDREFFSVSGATITPLDGNGGSSRQASFIMVARRHVTLVALASESQFDN